MAQRHSFEAKQAYYVWQQQHYNYLIFKLQFRPTLTLNAAPMTFSRTIVQRYDAIEAADVFVPQQNIYSYATLTFRQILPSTGGEIYMDTDLDRLQNFGTNAFINYTATPARVGFRQPLGGFNPYKWQKLIEPVAYRKAQKALVASRERVAQSAVTYFFDLLMAELDIQRSQADTRQTDTLLDMARKRLAIGTLTKDDVLELELQKIQSQQALQNAQLNYDNRLRILRSYIGLSDHQVVQLMLPEEVTPLKISVDEAIQRAHKDNPDLLQLRQNEMEAERDRDQTIRDNRFQASIDASFGLNQSDSTISSALTNLLDQQVVMVRLSIPLLDWGRRKNIQKVAEAKQMAVYEAGNQARQELDWELQRQVQRLDLLFGQIKANQKIDDLARARFQITQQRFFKGSVDLIKLSAARLAYVQAQQAYLQSLRAYWETLFAIRATTLYDFIAGSPIKVALD